MFVDTNNDGGFNGEPTVHINADGDCLFGGINVGTVNVYEVPQDGLQPTVGGLLPTLGASDHRQVTVAAMAITRNDFADRVPQIGNLSGNVWTDANGDGTRVASELGISARTVFVDLSTNGALDIYDPSQITDVNGAYAFVGIRGGIYGVTEVIPTPWNSAEGRPSAVRMNVFVGGTSSVDFFNLVPVNGSGNGVHWEGLDGNGIKGSSEVPLAGWQVYVDTNANGTWDAIELIAIISISGTYSIAGVPYGTSTIREIIPSNWGASNPATGSQSIKLLNGENRAGVNFRNREKIGTIQGTLWNDANGDGLRTATTNAAGTYVFTRVPVGINRVNEVIPKGWMASIGKPSTDSVNVNFGGVHVVDFYDLAPVPRTVSGIK